MKLKSIAIFVMIFTALVTLYFLFFKSKGVSLEKIDVLAVKDHVEIVNTRNSLSADNTKLVKNPKKVSSGVEHCDVKGVGVLIFNALQDMPQNHKGETKSKLISNSDLINSDSYAEYHDVLESIDETDNYATFLSYVAQRDFDSALINLAESRVEGTSFISKALSINPDIPQKVIHSLASHSGGLTFSDTVALMKAKYEPAIIYELISSSTINAQKYWLENGELQSLALLAASNLDYELFEHWYLESSPIGIKDERDLIFKRIGIPKNETEYQSAFRILSFIKDYANINPSPESIAYLKQWAEPELLDTIFSLSLGSDDLVVDIKQNNKIAHNQNVSDLVKSYGECISRSKEFDSIELLVEAVALDDREYIESELFVDSNHRSLLSEYPQKINQLLSLMQQEKWSDSLMLADDIKDLSDSNDVYFFAAEMLITLKSPMSPLDEVIERGAGIRPEFMLETILLNDLERLKILDDIGTDWKFTSYGLNALHVANAYNVDKEIIDFLIEKEVPLISDGRGLTVSDYLRRTKSQYGAR